MKKILFLILFLLSSNTFALYDDHSISNVKNDEIICLANNIYFESRSESDIGKIAVAFVTMNRVNAEKYPTTICEVVKEKRSKKTYRGCQFEWYCIVKNRNIFDKNILTTDNDPEYNIAMKLATYVYINFSLIEDPTDGALYFHNKNSFPVWRHNVKRTVKIGNHIFYAMK